MNETKIVPAVPTENKEIKENVLTNEQLEELKKNLSPEEIKQYEILASVFENSNSPEDVKKKLSELTDDQLSCAAGGLDILSTDTKKVIDSKIKWHMAKVVTFGALAGIISTIGFQDICKGIKSNESYSLF